jgi:large subunit ribosomal protein L10
LAISKEKKQQIVADYVDKMSQSQAIILTDYRGLSVADLSELRRKLRDNSGAFQIIKNTLFKLALEQASLPVPAGQMEGTVAAGYCLEEVPPVAKTLTDFADETKILRIRGAILGTNILDADGVQSLADLPPREILLATLLGAVQGPMSGLVSTLNAPLRELAQVLQARAEQGPEGQSPAEAAA